MMMPPADVTCWGQVYTALISACSREILNTPLGNRRLQLVLLERAHGVLAEMRAARLKPDAVLWNALITAAGRAGQLQRAFQTLEEMQVGRQHHKDVQNNIRQGPQSFLHNLILDMKSHAETVEPYVRLLK